MVAGPESTPESSAAKRPSSSSSQKKSRRVVRLSRVDAERLARGEISTPEEALRIYDAPPVKVTPIPENTDGKSRKHELTPHEREILANVPPHFGKI